MSKLFQVYPEIKSKLWEGNLWPGCYYVIAFGQYENEEVIRKYIENQDKGKEYKKIYDGQLMLDF